MTIDIPENEFYVCLLSNNSSHVYTENTLSAFTNLLKYPLKLTKDWVVGITEIAFNRHNSAIPFRNKTKRSIDNRDFGPSRKHMKINVVSGECFVFMFGNNRFVFTENFLHKIEIQKNVVQLSRILSTIKSTIKQPHLIVYMKTIFESILKRLKQAREKNDIKRVEYRVEGGKDFVAQVELHNTNKLAVLKCGKTYDSINHLIEDLVGQVDMNVNDYDTLISMVENFLAPRNVDKNEKENIKFYIDLKDIGATVKIKKPLPEKLTINEFGSLLIDNIKFDDDNLSDDEKESRLELVQEQIIKVFNNLQANSMDAEQGTPILNPTSVLNIPYEKTGRGTYKTTPVPFENMFSDLETFLSHLFVQTPPDKRKPDIVGEAITKGIQKAVGEQIKNISPAAQENYCNEDGSDFNMMQVYTDIIQPKIIGNMHTRFLKVVPLLTKNTNVLRFKHIEYCPVEKTFIESVSIKLTDNQGELIDFAPSYIPTYVMLHFKNKV